MPKVFFTCHAKLGNLQNHCKDTVHFLMCKDKDIMKYKELVKIAEALNDFCIKEGFIKKLAKYDTFRYRDDLYYIYTFWNRMYMKLAEEYINQCYLAEQALMDFINAYNLAIVNYEVHDGIEEKGKYKALAMKNLLSAVLKNKKEC